MEGLRGTVVPKRPGRTSLGGWRGLARAVAGAQGGPAGAAVPNGPSPQAGDDRTPEHAARDEKWGRHNQCKALHSVLAVWSTLW